jgi:hypothetical protein
MPKNRVFTTERPEDFNWKCPECHRDLDEVKGQYVCVHRFIDADSGPDISLDTPYKYNQNSPSSEGGVWNVKGAPVQGAGRLGQKVTATHQRLNAAEAVVASVYPALARSIRTAFDQLEVFALRGKTESIAHPYRWLWASGRVLFPAMGWAAELLVTVTGNADIIPMQYRIASTD